jgi:hypothetical protein
MPGPTTLEAAVHLIQVALTPIFLLSGIAAMLNVIAARLARVADRLDHLSADLQTSPASAQSNAEIAVLHQRSMLLEAAVVLGTVGTIATCLAILTLFFLGISAIDVAGVLLLFFGAAIVCTLGSVTLFGLEMVASSSGLRARMRLHAPDLALPRFFRRRGGHA